MRHDEDALLAVKGVENREWCPTDVEMVWQVRWLDAISQEEGIPPFLIPQIYPIDGGGRHGQPRPHPLDTLQPLGFKIGCGGPGLSQGCLRSL